MESIKIQNIRLYRYTLPLTRSISLPGQAINTRSGLVLVLEDADGHVGYGEIAPLPGLHQETLDDCLAALRPRLHSPIKFTPQDLMTGNGPVSGLPPSVALGWDMACLDMLSDLAETPLHKLLNPNAADFVYLNALIMPNDPDPITTIRMYLDQGYGVLKLKVGQASPKEDADRINAVTKEYGKLFVYRLDANRAWSMDQALEFFKRLKRPGHFDYIEEPLADPALLPELTFHTSVPIALDESLFQFWDNDSIPEWVGDVIIKPAVLGPLSRTLDIISRANRRVINVTITSCYESGLALDFYARLAAATTIPYSSAGLDTWRLLERDLVKPPFSTKLCRVDLNEPPPGIDWSMLQPVDL